jgi:polar amino acid transport system substrate-binding protein
MTQRLIKIIIGLSLTLLMILSVAQRDTAATEPRITPYFLDANEYEIFACEYPPLVSSDIPGGGLCANIVLEALKEENVHAVVTTLPLENLVRSCVVNGTEIAVLGEGRDFSAAQRKNLIIIPFLTLKEEYVYYKPAHKHTLSWKGKLENLRQYRYGTQKGNDISPYVNSGISIVYGDFVSLFKKLKNREIDFLSTPEICKEWIAKKYFPDEMENFAGMQIAAREMRISIIFNKNHPEGEAMAKKFVRGFNKIRHNGKYIEILEKYYSTEY